MEVVAAAWHRGCRLRRGSAGRRLGPHRSRRHAAVCAATDRSTHLTLQRRSKEGRTSRGTDSPASESTPLTTSMPTPCGEVAHEAPLGVQVHRRSSPHPAPTNVVAAAKTRGSFALTMMRTTRYRSREKRSENACSLVFVGFTSLSRCVCVYVCVGGCVLYSLLLSHPTNSHLEKTHHCSLRFRVLLLFDPLAELCTRTCAERFALAMRLALVSTNPV